MTSMHWVNESQDTLLMVVLMVGTDDGNIRIFRDEGSGSDLVSGQVTAANRACDSSIIVTRHLVLNATRSSRSFRLGGKSGQPVANFST